MKALLGMLGNVGGLGTGTLSVGLATGGPSVGCGYWCSVTVGLAIMT